ncbi:MAG: DUF1499 domain-containing protein [Beijerinckiaceae bacterium]
MRRRPTEPMPVLAPIARFAALGAAGAAVLSIVAARFGGVPASNALALLGTGIVLAALALIACGGALASIWRSGAPGAGVALRAAALSALVLAGPAWFAAKAVSLPVLNDVTTNIDDPPSFARSRAALGARGGYQPPEFDPSRGPEIQAAYRDLAVIVVELDAADAFDLALRTATELGWTITDSTPPGGRTGSGRIEAISRSTLYRFEDDVTIRIKSGAGESQIDLRSASRMGRHDFGANAARIRAFAQALEAAGLAR